MTIELLSLLGVLEYEVADMNEYTGIYCDLTGKIIKAAIEVHTEFGCGLKEEAYEAALAWELSQRGHKVLRQVPCPVIYKGKVFCQDDEHPKRIDMLVDDKIVVELKAVCTKHPVFTAQCRTYLLMLDLPTGLVLNFGFPSMRDGIEHVSNPRATAYKLQDSETPRSRLRPTGGDQNEDAQVQGAVYGCRCRRVRLGRSPKCRRRQTAACGMFRGIVAQNEFTRSVERNGKV